MDMDTRVSRSQLRQQRRRQTNNYLYLKKSTALLGTALVAASVVAPLMNASQADAETNSDASTANSSVDKQSYISSLAGMIEPEAEKNDLYASVMLAQAILESNWGQNEFAKGPYFNVFGLEGQYEGNSAILPKTNLATGLTEQKELKDYDSYEDAVADYVQVMKTTEENGDDQYFSGTWKHFADNYQAAAQALQDRFSESSTYAQELIQIIEENNLTNYDTPAKEITTPAPTNEAVVAPETYTVQSGDSVWSITNQHNISTNDFVSWNNLQDNDIYTGQTVVVGNGEDSAASATTNTPVATPEVTTPAPTTPVVDNNTNVEVPVVDTPVVESPTVTAPVETAPVEENTPVENNNTVADEQVNTTTPEATTPTDNGQATTDNARGEAVVAEAEKYLGTDYVWGGRTPEQGFDCSGLTQYVYQQVTGEDIGSWTVAQESSGTQIAVSDAQAGDLLFWGQPGATTHVAISTGDTGYIHAPQPGQEVKYGDTQWYTPDFGVRVY
ncbi:glucosaminidase domain-containing protein [Enterococcus alishanensis]